MGMSFGPVWKNLKQLDAWVGRALTQVLALFSRRPASFAGSAPSASPRRVICAQFTGLGNVALALPLLRALREKGVSVAFWSFTGQAEIVSLSNLVDEVWSTPARPSFFVWGWIPALLRARRFRADAFVDLETASSLSAVLAKLSGAKTRIGYYGTGSSARERLYTHLVSVSSVRHISETHLMPLVALGLGKAPTRPPAFPPLPDLSAVRTLLPDVRGRKRVIVSINSNESRWHRHWPEANWTALCNQLLEDRSIDLFFPGGVGERDRIQALIAGLRDPIRAHNLAGEPTLAELLKLLSESELIVTIESGVMHLAAWTGRPMVALFGPQSPEIAGPLNPRAKTFWGKTACSPCYAPNRGAAAACRDNQCMKRIEVDEVVETCRAQLAANERGQAA